MRVCATTTTDRRSRALVPWGPGQFGVAIDLPTGKQALPIWLPGHARLPRAKPAGSIPAPGRSSALGLGAI